MKKFAIALILLGSTFSLSAPVTYAASSNAHNPGGNNGIVKINHDEAPDSIPNNHPHVGCTFRVDFYNFDKGNYNATVDFALQAPTASAQHTLSVSSGNLRPFIGGDAAGGGTDLDASQSYKLTFTGAPHAQQGYHVKVTVHAPGSKGSDKKHKVFWVEACKTASATPTPSNGTPQVLGSNTQTPTVLPAAGITALPVLLASIAASIVGYFTHLQFAKRFARTSK